MSEELKNIKVSKIVDARGTSCPGPILAAKKAIVDVKAGEVMEILATDSGTQKDIPAWAKKMGHEYLGVIDDGGTFKLYVKRVK
ncbi:MAG: sulfurtransferase TusA family protein [Peptococcaceae bacterium]|nr:MAG: sulfurtransferase TusA family protein [Peptococcaceae bacterium]